MHSLQDYFTTTNRQWTTRYTFNTAVEEIKHDEGVLRYFMERQQKQVVEKLLLLGANPNEQTDVPILHYSTRLYDSCYIHMLLKAGASINTVCNDTTALCYSIGSNNTETAHILIDHGADPSLCAPIVYCCKYGRYDILERLLILGARDIESINSKNGFLEACSNGKVECVQLLLKQHYKVTSTRYLEQGLIAACVNNQSEIIKLLLDTDVDLDVVYGLNPSLRVEQILQQYV